VTREEESKNSERLSKQAPEAPVLIIFHYSSFGIHLSQLAKKGWYVEQQHADDDKDTDN